MEGRLACLQTKKHDSYSEIWWWLHHGLGMFFCKWYWQHISSISDVAVVQL